MNRLIDWVTLAIIIFGMAVIIRASELGKDGATILLDTLTAIGTGAAAIMAAKSAKAARDAADQWKVQMEHQAKMNATLDALTALNNWRSIIVKSRATKTKAADILTSSPHDKYSRTELASQLLTILTNSHLEIKNAFNNFSTHTHRARILGIYDHTSYTDLEKLQQSYQQAVDEITHLMPKLDLSTTTNINKVANAFKIVLANNPSHDEYGNELHGCWINFETRYKTMLKNL